MHLAAAGVRARWDDAGRAGTAGGRPVFSIALSIRSPRRVPRCHALEASARSFKKRYLKFQYLWLWRVCQLVTTIAARQWTALGANGRGSARGREVSIRRRHGPRQQPGAGLRRGPARRRRERPGGGCSGGGGREQWSLLDADTGQHPARGFARGPHAGPVAFHDCGIRRAARGPALRQGDDTRLAKLRRPPQLGPP